MFPETLSCDFDKSEQFTFGTAIANMHVVMLYLFCKNKYYLQKSSYSITQTVDWARHLLRDGWCRYVDRPLHDQSIILHHRIINIDKDMTTSLSFVPPSLNVHLCSVLYSISVKGLGTIPSPVFHSSCINGPFHPSVSSVKLRHIQH